MLISYCNIGLVWFVDFVFFFLFFVDFYEITMPSDYLIL